MISFEMNDRKKIGLGLTAFGVFFSFLGIIFFFDKGLLAMGNILFLSGVMLTIGLKSSIQFFMKRSNFKGTISFGVGFFFVVIGWPVVGMMLEAYGFIILFSGFWPTLAVFVQKIPILGWIFQQPFIRSEFSRRSLFGGSPNITQIYLSRYLKLDPNPRSFCNRFSDAIMISFEMNDRKKIGLGLTAFGVFFSFLGIIFFFDKGLLAMGNILFLSGVMLTIGLKSSIQFFMKRSNFKGTISFGVGFFFVVIGWPVVGMMLEAYGFIILFSGFWPTLAVFVQKIPILGWIFQQPFIRSEFSRRSLFGGSPNITQIYLSRYLKLDPNPRSFCNRFSDAIMISFEMNDRKKIGLGLTAFGVFFSFLGIIFFFDKGLLAMGNILFLSGVMLTIGLKSSIQFFMKRSNFKGTISFGVGFFFVVIGWPVVGMMLEAYGFIILFSGFWPTLAVFVQKIPILGWIFQQPFIRSFLDRNRGKRVPV